MAKGRLVEATVSVGPRPLALLRPENAEELIDEAAFAREEFLPYWAELWPSALALARALPELPLAGRRVLELGCGLALPALAAAAAGARVLATDWSAEAIALLRVNARRNGIELETAVVSWERPEGLLDRAPWDLVVASDVLYERRHVPLLLALLHRLGDDVLLADPGRPPEREFFEAAKRDWTIETTLDGSGVLHRMRGFSRTGP